MGGNRPRRRGDVRHGAPRRQRRIEDNPLDGGAQSSTLDSSILEDLRKIESSGTEGFLDRLLTEYFSSSPVLITNLREALDGKDLDAMRDAAHTLKSSSAYLGAMQLASIAEQLEELARKKRTDQAEQLIAALEPELARVKLALQKEGTGWVH